MKLAGFLVSIVAAWAVRWLSLKLSEMFGVAVTDAQTTDMTNYISGVALVACMGAVEYFERVAWPNIRAKLSDKWPNWFPPK
jgi:hypothetical protein